MKCMIKAETNKESFLDTTNFSIECKQKGSATYGWYETKREALRDGAQLQRKEIRFNILKGWENDGFVTIKLR